MMFTEPLAAKIIKGEKTATRRVMSDNPRSPWSKHRCLYEVGQTFSVNPGRGVVRVAEGAVTAVYEQPLGEMRPRDAELEGFEFLHGEGVGSFHEAWARINGEVDPNEAVWVIEFVLIPASVSNTRATEFVARVEKELAEAGK